MTENVRGDSEGNFIALTKGCLQQPYAKYIDLCVLEPRITKCESSLWC